MRNGLVSGLPGDALIIATCYLLHYMIRYQYVWIRVDRMCALLWADSKKGSMGAIGSVVRTCSMLSITPNHIETRQSAELPHIPRRRNKVHV